MGACLSLAIKGNCRLRGDPVARISEPIGRKMAYRSASACHGGFGNMTCFAPGRVAGDIP